MSQKIFFLSVIFSLACFQLCPAQDQHKIDSLLIILKTAKEDTNKFQLLVNLAKQYMNVNPKPMLPYIQQAVALADQLNYDYGKFIGVNLMAIYYYLNNDLKMALKYAEQNLKKAEQNNNAEELFLANNMMASIYDAQGEFKLATPLRLKALEMAEKMKNENLIAAANNNIGINYESLGYYAEALAYYFSALKVREAKKDSVGIANSNNCIGDVYFRLNDYVNGRKYHLKSLAISEKIHDVSDMIGSYYRLGVISLNENKLEEANNYLLTCLKYSDENNHVGMTASAYQGLGRISAAEGNHDKALRYYNQALFIFEQSGDKMGISSTLSYVGIGYMKKNNFNKALHYYQRALAIADSTGFKPAVVPLYKSMAEAYAQSGDYKKAYQYALLHNELGDSLLNDEIINKTTELREKYETEKKEKEIALLNASQEVSEIEIQKQKVLKNAFIGGLGLLSILTVVVFSNFRNRNKLRLQRIRNRIADDLHDDIGSTLNSISVYSEVAKQKSPAVVLELEQIGEASRKIIDAMSDIVWTINAKNDSFEQIILRLRSLTYNLLRAKSIEHTFRADENLNAMRLSMENRRNFYLIFKEALNNLVKYANASRVSISLLKENNFIILTIHDNGVGFDSHKTHSGNGLFSMKTRAEEMNAVLKIESELGDGTNVELKWKV